MPHSGQSPTMRPCGRNPTVPRSAVATHVYPPRSGLTAKPGVAEQEILVERALEGRSADWRESAHGRAR
jgi:hypothetical protein